MATPSGTSAAQSSWSSGKRRAPVLDLEMAYVSEGQGRPIVFLHGNVTSSYLWRQVIPRVQTLGRCIAPDLVGAGDSDKLPDPSRYGFDVHREYLEAFLDAMHVDSDAILVLHDWGSVLGFDWAHRHRDRIAGIAYMEAITRVSPWDQVAPGVAELYRTLRSPEGERLVIEQNLFIETVLPRAVIRSLDDREMAEYRRPYLAPSDRWPMLAWARALPFDGDPDDVAEVVDAYAAWLSTADVPKLLISADPGASLTGEALRICRGWPYQAEVTVPGRHFLQEDSSASIGDALARWITGLGDTRARSAPGAPGLSPPR